MKIFNEFLVTVLTIIQNINGDSKQQFTSGLPDVNFKMYHFQRKAKSPLKKQRATYQKFLEPTRSACVYNTGMKKWRSHSVSVYYI